MENFAKRLVQLRKEKGYTQSELADKIGVSNKSVSRWETGEGYPDISVLVDLADALDVSVDALLRDDVGYHDIEKKDLEEYLPFIIAICGFLGYHIMVKLGISLIPAVIGYFVIIHASHYMMRQHTDRQREPLLGKVNALFNFFVIEGCCVQVILIFQIAGMMGVSPIQLFGTTTNLSNMSDLGFDLGTTILLSLIIAGIATTCIYLKYMDQTKKSTKKNKNENGR